MTNETIFFAQMASIVVFLFVLFGLYRILVSQKDSTIQAKDSTIQGLKEKCEYLDRQLKDKSQSSPDILLRSLNERVKTLDEEMARLYNDKDHNKEEISQKEQELNMLRKVIEEVDIKLADAHELMEDFFCPHCGAPMSEKICSSEPVEYDGREIDDEREYVAYECGYTLVDGSERNKCRRCSQILKG